MLSPKAGSFSAGVHHRLDLREQRIELRRALELGKLVITADRRAVDEDLWHRAPSKGAVDHLLAQGKVAAHIDLGEGDALLGEEMLGGAAIAAIGRGVEDDFLHLSSAARPFGLCL